MTYAQRLAAARFAGMYYWIKFPQKIIFYKLLLESTSKKVFRFEHSRYPSRTRYGASDTKNCTVPFERSQEFVDRGGDAHLAVVSGARYCLSRESSLKNNIRKCNMKGCYVSPSATHLLDDGLKGWDITATILVVLQMDSLRSLGDERN